MTLPQSECDPILNIKKRLDQCSTHLRQWKTTLGPPLKSKIRDTQLRLKSVQNCPHPTEAQLLLARKLENELDQLLYKEEEYWKQRSRVNWLKLGDKNTKYFHQFASSRRATNKIHSLLHPDGSLAMDNDSFIFIIEQYFSQLFTSQNPSVELIDRILTGITEHISDSETESLNSTYTDEEIQRAVFQLASDKAPGSDGFTGTFFQKNWHVIGQDVLQAAKGFLNGNANIGAINNTVIVLIPKRSHPQQITDYRPISLCSTLYKVISRVLVNRLKPILSRIISPTQSAFLPGRLISDNIIIAQEVTHALAHRKTGRTGWMGLKLDMAKAFDRVEWGFLQKVMEKFKFPHRFINLVMSCISTVSFSFSINQQILGSVTPSRGIRQGDPLSPYLFLLCSEGLSALIAQYTLTSRTHNQGLGLKIARTAPIISHLFFADDSLLFSQATPHAAETIKEVLHDYSLASGQMVNFDKSSLYFSPNTTEDIKHQITTLLGIPIRVSIEKYLGLPQSFGRSKKEAFNYLTDRVCISWGKELLKMGIRKSIGDGTTTSIFNERWIPDYGQISYLAHLSDGISKVSDLITPSHQWDVPYIDSIFPPDISQAIQSITLIPIPYPDTFYWPFTPHGNYTVNSGYHLAHNLNHKHDPSPSHTTDTQTWWKTLWTQPIPSKTKHFIWRAYYDILPTSLNLQKRKTITTSTCCRCSNQTESLEHALFRCGTIQKVWKLTNLFTFVSKYITLTCRDILHLASIELKANEFQFFLCLLWKIWHCRNEFLHHRRIVAPVLLLHTTADFLEQYQKNNTQQHSFKASSRAELINNDTISSYHLKLTVDAAQNVTANKTGLGFALYNSNGDRIMTVASPWNGTQPPLLMEAHGLYYALSWCQKHNIVPDLILSDCKYLVDYVCKNDMYHLLLNRFAKSIKSLLSSLPNATFRHIPRKENEDAHCLAKFALGLDQETCWKAHNLLL
uniref:Reverse transcriptase domain-containing protein n=1 Tax=Cannabis sativa TaxID=3483 RepID=A0A803P400_CANSA